MSGRQAALLRMAVPVGALCACATVDPENPPGWILCPFRLLTGLPCPMCGMTRGIASLLRGRWPEAIGFHLFSPLVLAALCAWMLLETGHALRWWEPRRTGHVVLQPAPWLASLAMLVFYGALRWWGIIGSPRA